MSDPTSLPIPPKIPNFFANEQTRRKFCGLYEECLDSLSKTFPECERTKELLKKYRDEIKNSAEKQEEMIRQWHADMMRSNLYTLADKKDATFWEQKLPLFEDIHFAEKYHDVGLTEESKQVMWEYMHCMNRHSRIFNAMPDAMLDQIHTLATQFAGRIQNGDMKINMQQFNIEEMKQVGQSLMSAINPDDLKAFADNITSLADGLQINNLQDIFKLIEEIPMLSELLQNESNIGQLLNQVMQSQVTQQLMENMDQMLGGKPPPPKE